jgi:hypothetical protein
MPNDMHETAPTHLGATRSGRLFLLEPSGDRIHSMNTDGSNPRTVVTACRFRDSIVVDATAGRIVL